MSGLRSLNNNKASLTWLVSWKAFWIGKKLYAVGLAVTPKCACCSELVKTLGHILIHCSVVRPLSELIKGYVVHILGGKFLVF